MRYSTGLEYKTRQKPTSWRNISGAQPFKNKVSHHDHEQVWSAPGLVKALNQIPLSNYHVHPSYSTYSTNR